MKTSNNWLKRLTSRIAGKQARRSMGMSRRQYRVAKRRGYRV